MDCITTDLDRLEPLSGRRKSRTGGNIAQSSSTFQFWPQFSSANSMRVEDRWFLMTGLVSSEFFVLFIAPE